MSRGHKSGKDGWGTHFGKRPEPDESIEAQCWICPKCHDDHGQSAPCTPMDAGEFMPSPDDGSYIAIQYRARVAERDELRARLSDCAEYAECILPFIPEINFKDGVSAHAVEHIEHFARQVSARATIEPVSANEPKEN